MFIVILCDWEEGEKEDEDELAAAASHDLSNELGEARKLRKKTYDII
jgi:hypothetical protein